MNIKKEKYNFDDLREIFKTLRGENGCAWDKKQTFLSLQKYLIEECYEYIDAVNENSPEKMRDELGDVLLQVMLNSQIADDEKLFDINSVIDNLAKKMIIRHPHVFAEVSDKSVEGILSRWEEIKKEQKGDEYSLKYVGKHLPAVLRAGLIIEKSKKMKKNQIILRKNLDKLRKMLDNMSIEAKNGNNEKITATSLCEMMMTIIELFVESGYNIELELNKEIDGYISALEQEAEGQAQ